MRLPRRAAAPRFRNRTRTAAASTRTIPSGSRKPTNARRSLNIRLRRQLWRRNLSRNRDSITRARLFQVSTSAKLLTTRP